MGETELKKMMAMPASLAIAALLLSGCGSSAAESVDTSPSAATSQTVEAAPAPTTPAVSPEESTFVDGVLSTPDVKIAITEHRGIPVGQPGNEYGSKPVIAFWYDITNVSGKSTTPLNWMFMIKAIQDNDPNAVNTLNIGSLPDDQFLESQTQEIKQGGTVQNAVAYELDDETTPVELVASDDVGMTELGRITYNLQ